MKIIIKPGNPKDIYCDKAFKCFLRRDGQLHRLWPDLFKSEFKSF